MYYRDDYGTTTDYHIENYPSTCDTWHSGYWYDYGTPDSAHNWNYNSKELLCIENALKATERMIMMGRVYRHPLYSNHHTEAFRAIRMMFSKSGYLPTKIKRIRK